MKISINNQEFDFLVRGTVGLVYLAERILGEAFNGEDKYHVLVLYYACLTSSNKGKEVPDMMEFIASLTSDKLDTIAQYFWGEWARLEPKTKEETAQGEG